MFPDLPGLFIAFPALTVHPGISASYVAEKG